MDTIFDLQSKFNEVKMNLENTRTIIREDEQLNDRYLENYCPNTKKILENIQKNLQVQNQAHYYDPSVIPAPYQQISSSINLTKETFEMTKNNQLRLIQYANSLRKNKEELSFIEKYNIESMRNITSEIEETSKVYERKHKEIFHEQEFYSKTANYQQLIRDQEALEKSIQTSMLTIVTIKEEQQSLISKRKQMEDELTEIKKIQIQNDQKLKEIQSDYNDKKKKLESIQQRHNMEIGEAYKQINSISQQISSQIQTVSSKFILLIDEFQQTQHQEETLKNYILKNKGENDIQTSLYQSQDRFNLSNISLTYKFHPPKLFSSIEEQIKLIADQKNNPHQDIKLIIVGNSTGWNLQKSSSSTFLQRLVNQLQTKRYKLQIFILEKCSSSPSLFKDIQESLALNNFKVTLSYDFKGFLSEIQKNVTNTRQESPQRAQYLEDKVDFQQVDKNLKKIKEDQDSNIQKQSQLHEYLEQINDQVTLKDKYIREEQVRQEEFEQQREAFIKKITIYIGEQQLIENERQLQPLKQKMEELQQKYNLLQKENIKIQKLISQITTDEMRANKQINEMAHFIDASALEMKKLFSILWVLKKEDVGIALSFLMFLERSSNFDERPENNLSEILKVSLNECRQFCSTIKFNANQNESTKQMDVNIQWKKQSSNSEYVVLFEKLKTLITPSIKDEFNKLETYPTYEQLNRALEKKIQELS